MKYSEAILAPVGSVLSATYVNKSKKSSVRKGVLLSARPFVQEKESGVEIHFPRVGRRFVPLYRIDKVVSRPVFA